MLFNSFSFFCFLPIAFICYWMLYRSVRVQNLLMVFLGFVFCGWINWLFVLPLLFVGILSFIFGLSIENCQKKGRQAKGLVNLAVIINLCTLVYFKYFNFFYDSVVDVLRLIGVAVDYSSFKIILPIGISYYVFQSIGYVIDVHRKNYHATHDLVAFLSFEMFFPRIFAGPIDRAGNLLNQFLCARRFDYAVVVDGCRQMLWGFFKKLVVADNCAVLANTMLDTSVDASGLSIFVGCIAYTIQIYGDFSGYSDIAIGCGKLFGFRMMNNFSCPYFSLNIADFWHRWHISLTTWFRDYLYIPLGGGREGTLTKVRNTFIVFLVSGLWHGADWTFILWGFFHAILFLPILLLKTNKRFTGNLVPPFISWFLTMVFVTFGWSIFRAPSISVWSQWMNKFSDFGGIATIRGLGIGAVPWLQVAVCFAVEYINRRHEHGLSFLPRSIVLRWGVYLFLVMSAIILRGQQSVFIYSQF